MTKEVNPQLLTIPLFYLRFAEATGDTSMEVFEVAQPTLRRRGWRTDSRFFSHRMLSRSGK